MKYDVAIIGAGISGLATAYKILESAPQLKLLMLEKESDIALHQTGRNSGVIHSGIYYKPGSLKAKNCADGYSQIVDFARKNDIPHEMCGKLIVATSESELPALNKIKERGELNGLEGLKTLTQEQAREIEPHVAATQALWVPQTGIINYKAVCTKFLEKFTTRGGDLRFGERVKNLISDRDSIHILTHKGNEYTAKHLVNCGGLYSDKLSHLTGAAEEAQIIPFRGEYYELKPEYQYLVKNLIYPVPDPQFPFLGVHFTRMIEGGIEAGPNAVLAFGREAYSRWQLHPREFFETLAFRGFHKLALRHWKYGLAELSRSFSKKLFTSSLQKLIPEITEDMIVPGNAGIRAQVCFKNGELCDDFKIIKQNNITHVCNAPSPAATSCLSIADHIVSEMGIS